jgi:hypothetical protein
MNEFDALSLIVIILDLFIATFLIWRVFNKKATLYWNSRVVYFWIALTNLYHGAIYVATFFVSSPNVLIIQWLHPIVVLYMLNPLLIAIIHWRGGRIL